MVRTLTRRRLGQDHARSWEEEERHRPRVLFESPDGAEAHAAWVVLRRHGYRTMWCPGPQDDTECALAATGRCLLLEEADAVVSALDLERPRCEGVARRLDAEAEGTPVVVVAPRVSAARWQDELPGCRVVAGPLSAKVLVRSLEVVGAPPPVPPAVPGR